MLITQMLVKTCLLLLKSAKLLQADKQLNVSSSGGLIVVHAQHGSAIISSLSRNKFICAINTSMLLMEDGMSQCIHVFLVNITFLLLKLYLFA